MPRKRAIMLVNWFGAHANVIMPLLAFGALAIGIWTILLYSKLEDQQSRLSGIEIARIVEQRASNRNAVIRCNSSIGTVRIANILLGTVKTDLLQRAAANRKLWRVEKNPTLKATRIKAAVQAERKAGKLHLFPKVTKKQCNELRDRLRAELVFKYGDKLRQLEKEERKSQRSDT